MKTGIRKTDEIIFALRKRRYFLIKLYLLTIDLSKLSFGSSVSWGI